MKSKDRCLYNQVGYQVKLVSSVTFNPSERGESDDKRDLSVLVKYIGAVNPSNDADYVYDEDPYVVSRVEPENGSLWNDLAFKGFYRMEPDGVWAGKVSTVNIKDDDILENGIRIAFYCPEQLKGSNGTLSIIINEVFQKEISITDPGYQDICFEIVRNNEQDIYIQNAQRILKLLLKDFDRVCGKYNLKYYLICGSLLGAVRHHDLIPWDDDVDVAMPRKDFDLLLKYAKAEWGENSDIQFVNYNQMGNHTFLDYMTRIIYMKEEIPVGVFRKIRGKGREDIDNHMPMDIYVLDNASDNLKKHKLQTQIIQGLYGLAMGHRAYINHQEYIYREKSTQKIVKIASAAGHFIPLSFILWLYEIVRKIYRNKPGQYYFESNGFIYCIPWRFKREWFGEGCKVQLGDLTVNAPQDFDAFLKMHYSESYMKFPPMEVRKPTHSVDSSGIF